MFSYEELENKVNDLRFRRDNTKSDRRFMNNSTYQKSSKNVVIVKVLSKGLNKTLANVLHYITKDEKLLNKDIDFKPLQNENEEMLSIIDIVEEYKLDSTTRSNGKDFYHFTLSTKEDMKDEKKIREIINNTLDKTFNKEYKYVLVAHKDTDNLHYHIVINTKNKITNKRLDITSEVLQNTRATFSEELINKGYDYRLEKSFDKEQYNTYSRKRNIDTYNSNIVKIQEIEPTELIKEFENLKKEKEVLYKEKTEKKISFDTFKSKSKPIFEKERLVHKAINGNFFLISKNLKFNITRLNEIEDKKSFFNNIFNVDKVRKLKKDNDVLVKQIIKNYLIKEQLNKIAKNGKTKNSEFNIKKDIELLKIIETLDIRYLSEKSIKKLDRLENLLRTRNIKFMSSDIIKNAKKIQKEKLSIFKTFKNQEIKYKEMQKLIKPLNIEELNIHKTIFFRNKNIETSLTKFNNLFVKLEKANDEIKENEIVKYNELLEQLQENYKLRNETNKVLEVDKVKVEQDKDLKLLEILKSFKGKYLSSSNNYNLVEFKTNLSKTIKGNENQKKSRSIN